MVTLANSNCTNLSATNTYIQITGNVSDSNLESLLWYINQNVISFTDEGSTTMILYNLNSERDKLNKDLIFKGFVVGNFKDIVSVKQISVDIYHYPLESTYNYVFIPKLKRFYYVTNVVFMNKDYTRLQLQEDVLMSWKNLIKSQKCFIDRYENGSNTHLIDSRYPVEDIPTISFYSPSNLTTCIELSYLMGNIPTTTDKLPNILVVTTADMQNIQSDADNISAPSGTLLPNIQSRRHGTEFIYLLNFAEFGGLVGACINNDAPASYIHSAILLPFNLFDIYSASKMKLYAGSKQLGYGEWVDVQTTGPEFYQTTKGGSPYIVIADFNFNSTSGIVISDSYLDFSPNTQWEFYIPFVGWVQVDANQVYNKRIMVYYTFDIDTGLSTAYIYNVTNDKIIHSASCQIGIKLPIATSNAEELARQQQATGLNLIMGLLSSALAIGVGAYSGNGVAVAGGVLAGGKAITNAVNTFNQMFERAQITYGSSTNVLYSPKEFKIRKTKHNPILSASDESTYKHINGVPYRKYVDDMSNLTGYVEVGAIHFDAKGNDIYNVEIDEIVALLKNGVIL